VTPEAVLVKTKGRLERESRTIRAMLRVYCKGVHGSAADLCDSCAELGRYADLRLARCPYRESKPACVKCPIHCYRADRRQEMRIVMRYAGPRMLLRHPVLALRHKVDGLRPAPPRPRKATAPS
jgi:hypothetical protein